MYKIMIKWKNGHTECVKSVFTEEEASIERLCYAMDGVRKGVINCFSDVWHEKIVSQPCTRNL
jgi:hypothetical protein